MTIDIQQNDNPNVIRLFFIRHGQTDYNANKIMQGHIDVDINDVGTQQAELTGKFLSSIPFDKFISSDLQRCVNTLKPIMEYQNCEFRTTSNLRERNMGPVEGLHVKVAIAKYGEDFRNLGENHGQLIKRLEQEVDSVIQDAINNKFTNIGICTHGGCLTAFFNYSYKQGYQLDGLGVGNLKVPYNTSISIIDIDKITSKGIIRAFGNTQHLGAALEVTDQRLR